MKFKDIILNAFRVKELRKKMFMTLLLIIIFRIGCFIPVPGLSENAFSQLANNGMFKLYDMLSGGAFQQVSLFAMTISPYINASIIVQLLTVAIPVFERWQKEGPEGRKKLSKVTKLTTLALALFQSIMMYFNIQGSTNNIFAAQGSFDVFTFFIVVLSFTAGTSVLMWLGEKITETGIGNGISMIIFAGIVAGAPSAALMLYEIIAGNGMTAVLPVRIIYVIAILAVFLAVIFAVVWVEGGERRIPVQYAKRVVGRKIYGGQSTHIPIKVNSSGVLPIIFAMSMLQFPATIVAFIGKSGSTTGFTGFINSFSRGQGWGYIIVYALLIVGFTFFYNIVYFDPVDISNNLKKNGGFVPGLRPGAPTAEYIKKASTRITWFGAIFLAILAVFPSFLQKIISYLSADIASINLWFGGTTVLILVGVALETVRQLESQLLMRNYKGFLD